jgi:NAD(P)-dependent dehydrogenase (short-subunit alcohol dehydrogenase family)
MNKQQWLVLGGLGAAASYWAYRSIQARNRYDFRDKTVLVTGGARGLGLVMARRLLHEGARVAVCARDPLEVERTQEELTVRGQSAAFSCDLRQREQVQELIGNVRRRFGPIDVLINNAGVINVGPLETMTLEDFQDAMATNFWAALYTTLEVLPEMRQRRHGRIVNISSIGGKISVPHLVPYCASKFALVGFSEGLRSETAKDGVVVTTICPGLMRTGSPRNASFKGRHRAEYALFSIMDSLPGSAMSAERAAAQILEACRRGDAEMVVSLPAKCAVLIHDLFPGFAVDALALMNRVLPGPGGIGTLHAHGYESESALAPSPLTALSEVAAQKNNEMGLRPPVAGVAVPREGF